ncbi:MAG: GntR family transcriptional regulator [Solirubrobacterales bacterium]
MGAAEEEISQIDLSIDGSGDEPLVDAVYHALRDAIVDGRLVGGQKLPQIPLAAHLGISRTPVRDALQRLAQEGLVRAVSFRGFVVSEFSAREVLDVYQVRLALEPMAVREALPHYTRMNLAQLGDICDATEATEAEDVDALYALNAEFHRTLVEPCPNRVAARMLAQLWQQPSSLRLFHAQAALGTAMKGSVAEHRQILGAIEARDHDLVIERVGEHIRAAQRETIEALGEPA